MTRPRRTLTNRHLLGEPPGVADLSVTKTAAAEGVLLGGSIAYVLTVTNNGPATRVMSSDVAPNGVLAQPRSAAPAEEWVRR